MYDWTNQIREQVEICRTEIEQEFDKFDIVEEYEHEEDRYHWTTAYLVLRGDGWEMYATLNNGYADNKLVVQEYPPRR